MLNAKLILKSIKGFRKTSTAISILIGDKVIINGKTFSEYFQDKRLYDIAYEPFKILGDKAPKGVKIKVQGGGLSAQAQAVRHSLAKLFSEGNEELRLMFKKLGLLVGDPRQVERKKAGKIKARKAYPFVRR